MHIGTVVTVKTNLNRRWIPPMKRIDIPIKRSSQYIKTLILRPSNRPSHLSREFQILLPCLSYDAQSIEHLLVLFIQPSSHRPSTVVSAIGDIAISIDGQRRVS